MFLAIEKVMSNIFIGSIGLEMLKKTEEPLKKYRKEKKQIMDRIKSNCKLTESEHSKNKEFISKLEDMTLRLKNYTEHIKDEAELLQCTNNIIVLYDHKFNMIGYNDSFKHEFIKEDLTDSAVFKKIINKGKRENIKIKEIEVYRKKLIYESYYNIEINGVGYSVNTIPVYNVYNNFDYFIQIYKKI